MRKIILVFGCLFSALAYAQPGTLDATFNTSDPGYRNGYGIIDSGDYVYTTAVQPDGKIILGGLFYQYNNASCPNIARLNANGSIDTSFNPGTGPNSYVLTSAIQSDGKIIIGGEFTTFNGASRNRIARLNTDGSLDTSFNPGTAANNSVQKIIIQTDGKIIIGGFFLSYNGTARSCIARLNATGSLDTTFNPGTGATSIYGPYVRSVALQPDGKIVVAGNFSSYNGTVRNNIARLNAIGTLDTTFNPGTGVAGELKTVMLQPDGKIVVAGNFSSYNGTARNKIARLSSTGALDTGFNPGTGADNSIQTIALQSDGKVIIGGFFSSYNGTPRNSIARVNTDGSIDNTYNPNTETNCFTNTASLQSDGKIILGFGFTVYGNTNLSRISRLNADGSFDLGFNSVTGANRTIYTSTLQPDGKIIIGGNFTNYNATLRNRIARINPDGSSDISFNPGTGLNGFVFASTLQPDGKIIIGGDFTSYNATPRNRIARLNSDGSLDENFNTGTGANGTVWGIIQQTDGKIIIGGSFTMYNGITQNRIARLNVNGTLDMSFNSGTGTDNSISEITLQSDGKIIIGGYFTNYNGAASNKIARLNTNGTLDTSFNSGTGANSGVDTIAIQTDGKIIIGGDFTSYNGTSQKNIARLNTDGSLDTSFNSGTGANYSIRTIVLQPNGKIILGGYFISYNGTPRSCIARLNVDGSLDASFNQGSGASNSVVTIALQPDGHLIIGGDFTSYNSIGRNHIARIIGDPPNTIAISAISIGSPFCPGQALTVNYLATGTYMTGNVFTAQLSDAFGSFSTPTDIGSNTALTSGTIVVTIPTLAIAGSGYRIRVISSNIATIGSDNGNDLSINGNVIYYADSDGDGFGSSTSTLSCTGAPTGYVANNLDSNDSLLTYVDADGDGFGSTVYAPSGPTNNTDCNDNQIQYLDADGDSFGSTTQVACGVTNDTDCNDNLYNLTNTCGSIVNLKLFIEGYYLGAGTMRSVKFNQDGFSPTTDVENITVELHSTVTPYQMVHTTIGILKTDGTVVCNYPTVPDGNFYIVVRTINTIDTWSAAPQFISASTVLTYDFTTSANQAYGSNMANLNGSGVYGFYSGDINKDGSIDGSDAPTLFDDVDNSAFGIQVADLNGDGSVDNTDIPMLVNNSLASIYTHEPN